jgi:hypothetical protein
MASDVSRAALQRTRRKRRLGALIFSPPVAVQVPVFLSVRALELCFTALQLYTKDQPHGTRCSGVVSAIMIEE